MELPRIIPSIDANGRLVVNWTGGQYETWTTITNPKPYYAKFTIFNSNYDVQKGWGFGSSASFSTCATMSTERTGEVISPINLSPPCSRSRSLTPCLQT